jgi:hypothetical protein
MKCPECNGLGKILTRKPNVTLHCEMCDSTGVLGYQAQNWRFIGEKMKAVRIAKRKPLRVAAIELKMQVATLSYMERGIIPPKPELYEKLKP